MKTPQVGLSLMMDSDFERAAKPLFEAGSVEVVEWSFDMGWGRRLPPWIDQTLNEFLANGNLLGHGVSYSALDASETNRQSIWLHQLSNEVHSRNYRHISEHFGFMGGGNFHISAPLPVPRTSASVEVGQQRLQDLAAVAQVPIGLENLAFAFSVNDVREQGPFLEELLAPVDGFLLLDLHNLYCQACNFGATADELLHGYPLDRVKELHLSGGSWSEGEIDGSRVRRDTHDNAVPEEVFEMLSSALQRCSNVEAVILERMGGTIEQCDEEPFREDYYRLREVVAAERP